MPLSAVIDKTVTLTDCQTELLKNTHITFYGGMRAFIFYEYQCVICEHLSVKNPCFMRFLRAEIGEVI